MVYTLVKESNNINFELLGCNNIKMILYGVLILFVFYLLFCRILKQDVVRTGIIDNNKIKEENKMTGSILFS